MDSRKSGMVAIAGRPNAGKSTLLNAILGAQISIVSPKAQTTRDHLRAIYSEDQGQIVFIDTPGIHNAKPDSINSFMVSEAAMALEEPNVVWYIIDPRSKIKHESVVLDLIEKSKAPVFLLMNKIDLDIEATEQDLLQAFVDELKQEFTNRSILLKKIFMISSLRKKGIKELLDQTWEALPIGPIFYPDEEMISDRPTRYFAGEMIREQLYRHLGDELPYSCAVQIESFKELDRLSKIKAVIYVERESQKKMVIGKGAKKIKEIGIDARGSIEKLIDQKVFLGLEVKVLKDWTKNKDHLKKMGYVLPKGSARGQNASH